MGGSERGKLDLVISLIHRQALLQNVRRHGRRHAAAVFPALDGDDDDIPRFVVRSEAGKPGDVIFLSAVRRLRGSGFPRDDDVLDPRLGARAAAPRAARFIDDLPESVADDLDLLLAQFRAEISADLRLVGNGDLAGIFIDGRCPFRSKNGLDQARLVRHAAIRDRNISHRHLERTGEHVTLANGDIGGVRGSPLQLRISHLHPLRPGHCALLFIRETKVVFLADAEDFPDPVDGIDPGFVAVLVEKGIARNLERIRQAESAMLAVLVSDPAFEKVIPVLHAAGAVLVVIRQDSFAAPRAR